MMVVMPTGLKNILSRPKLLVPTLIVAVGMIVGVVVIAVRSNKPAQAAPRAIDVEVVRVEQKDVPVYSEWIGTTEGLVNADIKAEVIGYLLKQGYKEGSLVKKGFDGRLFFVLIPNDGRRRRRVCL
jgi:membrane fusion protein (multidrug efflux system)